MSSGVREGDEINNILNVLIPNKCCLTHSLGNVRSMLSQTICIFCTGNDPCFVRTIANTIILRALTLIETFGTTLYIDIINILIT